MGWEEISNDEPTYDTSPPGGFGYRPDPGHEPDASPFGGVEQVDGLVYGQDQSSPELRLDAAAAVPLPPRREMPLPPQAREAQPWRPGGDVDPGLYRPKSRRVNPLKPFLLGMIPLLFIAAVVAAVMSLYGYI